MKLARRLNAVRTVSKVTLRWMNLARRLNAVGAFSKVMGIIVDILEGYAAKDKHVNDVQRKKNNQVNELQRKKDTRP